MSPENFDSTGEADANTPRVFPFPDGIIATIARMQAREINNRFGLILQEPAQLDETDTHLTFTLIDFERITPSTSEQDIVDIGNKEADRFALATYLRLKGYTEAAAYVDAAEVDDDIVQLSASPDNDIISQVRRGIVERMDLKDDTDMPSSRYEVGYEPTLVQRNGLIGELDANGRFKGIDRKRPSSGSRPALSLYRGEENEPVLHEFDESGLGKYRAVVVVKDSLNESFHNNKTRIRSVVPSIALQSTDIYTNGDVVKITLHATTPWDESQIQFAIAAFESADFTEVTIAPHKTAA
ncbi:MAG: hypothetical protein O2904_03200 [bacterium]|nr:hypothetical protein [bacterium]